MTKRWSIPLKILYSVGVSSVFVAPALAGYALKLQITRQSFWALGFYGIIVFTFIFLQLLFATLNRCLAYHYRRKQPSAVSCKLDTLDIEKLPTESSSESSSSTAVEGRPATKMGLAVVGYREEPTLFTKCLESVQQLNYPDPFKIIVVIDGDEPADREMADIFQKMFPSSPVLVLPELLSVAFERIRNNSDEKIDYDALLIDTMTLPTDTMPVCYLQPHRGKRHAMYTAFRVLMAAGCEAVMSTDSDTKFDPAAMLEMERALYWFPNIGAAAGDVRIWNTYDSLLSFMSSLRYWMAFNIERAAQSLNRCVTCVSGPMGIYKTHVLREILDDWITQTFLGLECTYGDDR
jgi:hyaluronan synthase